MVVPVFEDSAHHDLLLFCSCHLLSCCVAAFCRTSSYLLNGKIVEANKNTMFKACGGESLTLTVSSRIFAPHSGTPGARAGADSCYCLSVGICVIRADPYVGCYTSASTHNSSVILACSITGHSCLIASPPLPSGSIMACSHLTHVM